MRRIPALLLLITLAAAASTAAAQSQPWTGASIISDPEWRKRFLGSYGFLSGAEPQVNNAELELLREVIELMKSNPRAAAAMLEPQAGPASSAALDFILANLHFQNGDLDAAGKSYRGALEKFPDFRRAHKNLGLLLVQENTFREALTHLTRAVELGDRDGRSYGLMGYCYLNLDNHLAAEEAYRNAILQEPDTRDWKLGLARALMAMEEYKEAAALFGHLIELDPDDPNAWLLQANAWIGLEDPLAAAVNLEAVRLMGKAQTSSLVLLGDIYMNAGMFDFARSAYLEVVERDQKGAQLTTAYRAADLLVRSRAFDEADEVLGAIDRRYGGKLDQEEELQVLTLKAKVARARGRDREAAELLESIVERDGTRGDALLELARYHESQGQSEKALMLIERAQNLEAFERQALLERAQLLVASRDYAKAAELLRRAQEIRQEARVAAFLERVEQAAIR